MNADEALVALVELVGPVHVEIGFPLKTSVERADGGRPGGLVQLPGAVVRWLVVSRVSERSPRPWRRATGSGQNAIADALGKALAFERLVIEHDGDEDAAIERWQP